MQWLEGAAACMVRGHGRLVGERRVDVDAAPTASVTRGLEATKAVVLATGFVGGGAADRRPARRPHRGTAATPPARSTVPDRLLVLGGGVVGVEMAQAWKRLGAREVTVIDQAPRLVPQFEPFASEQLRDAFEAEGITVVLDADVDARASATATTARSRSPSTTAARSRRRGARRHRATSQHRRRRTRGRRPGTGGAGRGRRPAARHRRRPARLAVRDR